MADITVVERRQLETLFDMSGGYVLDFSNRTFAEFFADTVGVDIYDDLYRHGSGSKANRLRGFLKIESDQRAGQLLADLVDYAEVAVQDADSELIANCRAVAARLREAQVTDAIATTPGANVGTGPLHVFLSYSWDSPTHKDWVRNLADELVRNGIGITLDQYDLRFGDDRFQFMESSVRKATAVLCVCTPSYVAKANDRTSGVGVETSLITPQFFERMNSEKQFIPIVRETDGTASPTPDYMSSLIFVDFRDDSQFALQMEQLLRHLHNEPQFEKPSIGPKPDFATGTRSRRSNAHVVDTEVQTSTENHQPNVETAQRKSASSVDDVRIGVSPKVLRLDDSEVVVVPSSAGHPEQIHVFDQQSVMAVNAAFAARRPLLVEGEPGIGIDTLPAATAHALARTLVRFRMSARTEPTDLMWTFDKDRRLVEAQLLGARAVDEEQVRLALDTRRFVTPGPLWWAFDWQSAHEQAAMNASSIPQMNPSSDPANGTVLHVDSVDRAESDTLVELIETITSGSFTPPGFHSSVVISGNMPLIILTSNAERVLPLQFVKRCLVLRMMLPQSKEELMHFLVRQGHARFAELDQHVLERAAEYIVRDRVYAIDHKNPVVPGLAEYLDLLRAVLQSANTIDEQLELLEMTARFTTQRPLE